MADYGADVNIPTGTNPSQAPNPVPAASPAPPAPEEGHPFNEDALAQAFGKIPDQQAPSPQPPQPSSPQFADQGSQTPAIGSFSQIAQANIGRNVNERLQIWSKMVGDKNAMVGPNSDVWIRGHDNKFYPADSDHTNMLQDFAKKSGAGIDTVAMAFSDLAGQAIGTGAGALAGGLGTAEVGGVGAVPGAIVGQKIGYIAGLAAGPYAGSVGRQFLETRLYGIEPDKEQVKRDALIGGALNVFMGGIFSGMGIGPQLAKSGAVGGILDKIGQGAAESASQRSVRIARAQVGAKSFFDAVGAEPTPLINESGAVNTSMSQAGSEIKGAVDTKRASLNSAIEEARNIIVSSPGKPDTLPLAQGIKDKLLEEGVRFDEHSMPIDPSERIPITASPVTNDVLGPKDSGPFQQSSPELTVGSVSRRQVYQMSPAVDQLMDNYRACVSGQMDKDAYLDMIKDWQSNSKFKMFETRPDAEIATWRKLQNMGAQHRNDMISQSLASSPSDLAKVQKAYSDYSSTKDALDLVDQNFKQAKNSPEKLAESFFQPGQNELLTQFQSAFKDNPELIRNARASWLSQKMSTHTNDGVFNSNSFLKDLQSIGGESLNNLFTPNELGSLRRSASIMGSVKSNDLVSQAQGDSVAASVAEMAHGARTNTQALLKWFQGKPQLADYVSRAGNMEKLASQTVAEDPTWSNNFRSALRNYTVGQKVLSNSPTIGQLATASVPLNPRQIGVAAIQSSPQYNQVLKNMGQTSQVPPQGTTGSEAAADQVFK